MISFSKLFYMMIIFAFIASCSGKQDDSNANKMTTIESSKATKDGIKEMVRELRCSDELSQKYNIHSTSDASSDGIFGEISLNSIPIVAWIEVPGENNVKISFMTFNKVSNSDYNVFSKIFLKNIGVNIPNYSELASHEELEEAMKIALRQRNLDHSKDFNLECKIDAQPD